MRHKIGPRAALLAIVAFAAAPAVAQTSGDWTWRATLYGYFPSVHSSTQAFDVPGGGIETELTRKNSLSNLQFAFMGALEARNGPWSILADVLYLNMGDLRTRVKTISGPTGNLSVPLQSNVSTDLKGFVGTFGVGYAIVPSRDRPMDVLAGARYSKLKAGLDWDFGAPVGSISRSGHAEGDKDFIDGIVGVRGRATLGGNWFVPYYADIGAGTSRFTWQALAGVGYQYGWGDITLVYRHLAYDFKSDRPMSDLSFSGPQIGLSFRF